ncbi:16S rRNA (guanine(527)-N(7))-methyltransferase RsmG [Nitrosovibrio tenuis]|uniref:Ribosomal RNA small subunit methyltransferase G n=1 Tax=Nitrosovibrio tenuis TaxID=1233 RepID=A0A1H7RCZ3_9PROT|nr:16S rRNA (guanine(527)-N(7))-methyltransferase RsmG [Nitrosovibrio tenuis]SEL58063.1 16S rRNA m(7)G-527 methyltransferase [Nitrosovibrio tenuis]
MNLASRLNDGISALGFAISEQTQTHLLQYLALIQKWNHVHNLTAVREPEAMLARHVLDSLAILPYIAGERIADVGSGAGLPGIPLALARPDCHVALIESNHKKAIFLQQARIELKLKNVEVVAGRVENFSAAEGFDIVVSRAFSDLADFVKLAGHLCKHGDDGGRLAAMKGIYPHEELAQLRAELKPQFIVEKILPIAVPSLEAERHLIMIKRYV